MGVFDKIKNALFEVEYVEVEEPPKKEKKVKPKEVVSDDSSKPIAKKIVLPGKKEEKVEKIEEEELKDDNFEARPKDEKIKEKSQDSFMFMDDNDFKVEDEYVHEEPEIVRVIDDDSSNKRRESKVEREYLDEAYSSEVKYGEEKNKAISPYGSRVNLERESKPYGLDSSYKVQVHEYGSYDKKDEKTYFKPSPIISPIYGILDKNYKKEDVVQKKEVRITSNYSRSNVSVDDIRNKAYGEKNSIEKKNTTFEIDDDDDNLLVDLSDDNDKPEVKEVTVGDALEYFQDLGLEYNVDYVDASKGKTTGRRVKDNYDGFVDEKKEEFTSIKDNVESKNKEEVSNREEHKPIIEVKNETNDSNVSLDDDDNLFDLIDSMYQENE